MGKQSFESVAEVKKGTDHMDLYLVYKINSKAMNSCEDYIFQSHSVLETLGAHSTGYQEEGQPLA